MCDDLEDRLIKLALLFAPFLCVAIACCASSCSFVPVGSCGVRTSFGKVTGDTTGEGLVFKAPFVSGVKIMDCRTQKIELKLAGATKDLQDVKATIALNCRLDKAKAADVYRSVGDEYVEKIVSPNMIETYKSVCAKYNAEELITKRQTVSDEIVQSSSKSMEKIGVVVELVSIVSFDFSTNFNEAVEAKVTAEQRALQAENELERVKFEAQQAEEKAKGAANARLAEAEAQAKAAKLIAESITPEYVAFEAVQKWDGATPTHILGDSILPMVDFAPKPEPVSAARKE